jgi:uncharacterized protein YcbX
MRIGAIAQLWRFPVKSMEGERLDSARLTSRGIPGDRGWAVHDVARDGITTAKRLPLLRTCRARYAAEPSALGAPPAVEVGLPDGRRVRSDSPEAPSALSELLGRAVTLRSLGAPGSAAPPRVTSAGDPPETLREMMGLVPGEPAADLSAYPPERLRELRRDNFFDAFPLHLLTRTTLRTLARLAPQSTWDERRFRCNLFIDTDGAEGYPELGWIDRRLRAGGAILEIVDGCPRCAMVTQRVDDLPHDPGVMRTLVRETRHLAGAYARVIQEGEVRVGDEVTIARD